MQHAIIMALLWHLLLFPWFFPPFSFIFLRNESDITKTSKDSGTSVWWKKPFEYSGECILWHVLLRSYKLFNLARNDDRKKQHCVFERELYSAYWLCCDVGKIKSCHVMWFALLSIPSYCFCHGVVFCL